MAWADEKVEEKNGKQQKVLHKGPRTIRKVESGTSTQQGQRNAGEFEIKRWFLSEEDLKAAESVILQFTVPRSEVPFGLEEKPVKDEDYTKERSKDVKNILDKDKIISEEELNEQITKQRKGTKDTGIQIGHLQKCQGGFVFYQKLLSIGYKIVGAHWELRLTEGQKEKGKGQPKNYIVELVMSKNGERKNLEEVTLKGYRRLLTAIYDHGNLWDNTKVPSRDNYVFNFQWLKKGEDAKRIIDLQLTQPQQAQRLNPISA